MTTVTLPPFSGDGPTCPKCGNEGARTEYRGHGKCLHEAKAVIGFEPSERLHRECRRCDYAWDEAITSHAPAEAEREGSDPHTEAVHGAYQSPSDPAEWLWRCEGVRHCAGEMGARYNSQGSAQAAYEEHAARDHGIEPTAGQLHARCLHPGWEYATTEGQRKQWDDVDTPPADDHGDPDPTWERNTDRGRGGWERFDYTEESYWRRRKVTA